MLANPARVFHRPRVPVTVLTAKPYESRNVGVLPVGRAAMLDGTSKSAALCGCQTYFTRAKVVAAVDAGEMRWVDRFHNVAAPVATVCGTWQKTASGTVHTMQLKIGNKGRHVPATQRDAEVAA